MNSPYLITWTNKRHLLKSAISPKYHNNERTTPGRKVGVVHDVVPQNPPAAHRLGGGGGGSRRRCATGGSLRYPSVRERRGEVQDHQSPRASQVDCEATSRYSLCLMMHSEYPPSCSAVLALQKVLDTGQPRSAQSPPSVMNVKR